MSECRCTEQQVRYDNGEWSREVEVHRDRDCPVHRAPRRVQMSRRRPWRKEHPDAVIVARPTRWGNPFRIGAWVAVGPLGPSYRIQVPDDAVRLFANWLRTPVNADGTRTADGWDRYFGATIADRPTIEQIRAELAGKDLACWCPLDRACHADVLLRIANGAW